MKLNDVKEWIENIVSPFYKIALGEYIETAHNKNNFLIVMQQSGGSVRPPFVQYPRYRFVILGRHGKRDDSLQLIDVCNDIIMKAEFSDPPCGATGARVLTLPSGAHYTSENRPYYVFEIEFII